MFAVPAPPPMLTKQEIASLRGKLNRIKKFAKDPNAQDPRIVVPLNHLVISINTHLQWQNYYFDPIHRPTVEKAMRCSSILEDVLVQVVVQGKDFDEVIAIAMTQPEGHFLHIYLQNGETSEPTTS